MKTPTSPAALRVARSLARLHISDVAEILKIPRRAIAAAEAGTTNSNDINVRLIEFYEAKGIEFLGDLSFGKEVARAGARWRPPASPDSADKGAFHSEKNGTAYVAARSLLNLKQSQVTESLGLPVNTVSALENSEQWPSVAEKLRLYYVENGVEFLGWCDSATLLSYGVGVRWAK